MAHQLLALIRHKASFHSLKEADLEGRRIPEEIFREMDMVIILKKCFRECGD